MLYMSINQYQKHSGLSTARIRADCKSGTLPVLPRNNGKYVIDVVKADKHYSRQAKTKSEHIQERMEYVADDKSWISKKIKGLQDHFAKGA